MANGVKIGQGARVDAAQIRSYRLRAHHLHEKLPAGAFTQAAGTCGFQDSPPGAWESAAFLRIEGCTRTQARRALCADKRLLNAWSFRGAPFVFPTEERDAFLTALLSKEGESPWIYTMGIGLALDYLKIPFADLLELVKEAALYLEKHTVFGKEALDQTLADIVEENLPQRARQAWRAPSMYGNPERQTVGGAAVSFLLRPCSFFSLVAFGERRGEIPSFTAPNSWLGGLPAPLSEPERLLARKFLHSYGPANAQALAGWLGCSRAQAERLWARVSGETQPVLVGGKTRWMLAEDMDDLLSPPAEGDTLLLLGAHDPYLDARDKEILLEDPAPRRLVWKTVANPGAILRGGRVAGIWRPRARGGKLDVSMALFEPLEPEKRKRLTALAEQYAAFRGLSLKTCDWET